MSKPAKARGRRQGQQSVEAIAQHMVDLKMRLTDAIAEGDRILAKPQAERTDEECARFSALHTEISSQIWPVETIKKPSADHLHTFFATGSENISFAARDEAREAALIRAQQVFNGGDRYGLWASILLSAAADKPVPGWARAALKELEAKLRFGDLADLNEALGWVSGPGNHQTVRRSRLTIELATRIAGRLVELKRSGIGMDAEVYDEVAKEFEVGRRAVERVWRDRQVAIRATLTDPSTEDLPVLTSVNVWEPIK